MTPSNSAFGSPLASALQRFLEFKRAAGYAYREEERALRVLDKFLADHLVLDDPVITRELIRMYVARRGDETETTREHRLSLIRQVCRFLMLEEPRTALPAPRFLGIHRRAFLPRVLTREEGRRFLRACEALTPGRSTPLRRTVLGTALILLYLTGLRAGEALRLTDADVDLNAAVLRVRLTKFGKSRYVPVAQDVAKRLADCRARVVHHFGLRGPDDLFLPGPQGHRYSISALRGAFREVLAAADVPLWSSGRRVRLHDLRHSFAVLRLVLWCQQNVDLGAMLPTLATYLGHVGLSSSQRYLQLTEDLLGEVTRRHQARFGSLITDGGQP